MAGRTEQSIIKVWIPSAVLPVPLEYMSATSTIVSTPFTTLQKPARLRAAFGTILVSTICPPNDEANERDNVLSDGYTEAACSALTLVEIRAA